jgi:hypothetical protein
LTSQAFASSWAIRSASLNGWIRSDG